MVLGFVETHGRAETAARIGDLEAVPLRKILYRSVILEEMDVDAVLARKPEFAVVDEVAHTNASGSRHNKRYQDVEEFVGTGINVIAAFNVQHLESLNQMVRRITGVEIRETIPDTFLARADQVVTVDIAVAELRQRLREGKIYPPEQVEQTLKNFFKPSNLAALRELALREVARDQSWKREELELLKREGGRRLAATERLMVCLSHVFITNYATTPLTAAAKLRVEFLHVFGITLGGGGQYQYSQPIIPWNGVTSYINGYVSAPIIGEKLRILRLAENLPAGPYQLFVTYYLV